MAEPMDMVLPDNKEKQMSTRIHMTAIGGFLAATFLFLIPLSAPRADELELIGDRPDFTESNATIPKGHLKVSSDWKLAAGMK